MTSSLSRVQQQLKSLRLGETASYLPELIRNAESEEWTYRAFLEHLTQYELKRREEKLVEKRLKWAAFPTSNTLDAFHLEEQNTLSKKQMNQLKEFIWLDQLYNLVLSGPAGVGNYRKKLVM